MFSSFESNIRVLNNGVWTTYMKDSNEYKKITNNLQQNIFADVYKLPFYGIFIVEDSNPLPRFNLFFNSGFLSKDPTNKNCDSRMAPNLNTLWTNMDIDVQIKGDEIIIENEIATKIFTKFNMNMFTSQENVIKELKSDKLNKKILKYKVDGKNVTNNSYIDDLTKDQQILLLITMKLTKQQICSFIKLHVINNNIYVYEVSGKEKSHIGKKPKKPKK